MRSIVLALAVLGTAAASSDSEEADKAKKVTEHKITEQMAKLDGTWQVVSWLEDGQNESADVLKYVRWTFKGNKLFSTKAFTITEDAKRTVKGQGGTIESLYQVDPSKSPYGLTGTTIRPFPGIITRSIYSVEGDTLKVCGYKEKKGLPSEFSAEKDSGRILIVLKREKKSK